MSNTSPSNMFPKHATKMKHFVSKRLSLMMIAIALLICVSLIFLKQKDSGKPVDLLWQVGSVWDSVERLISNEPSEPTLRANQFLASYLESNTQLLISTAEASGLEPYEEFVKDDLPADVQQLNPEAVVYFDSNSNPDGKGILFIINRHRGWNAGILICLQRNSEWQGAHLNGHTMSTGPDFGFKRLRNDGVFWHWYRGSWAAVKNELTGQP